MINKYTSLSTNKYKTSSMQYQRSIVYNESAHQKIPFDHKDGTVNVLTDPENNPHLKQYFLSEEQIEKMCQSKGTTPYKMSRLLELRMPNDEWVCLGDRIEFQNNYVRRKLRKLEETGHFDTEFNRRLDEKCPRAERQVNQDVMRRIDDPFPEEEIAQAKLLDDWRLEKEEDKRALEDLQAKYQAVKDKHVKENNKKIADQLWDSIQKSMASYRGKKNDQQIMEDLTKTEITASVGKKSQTAPPKAKNQISHITEQLKLKLEEEAMQCEQTSTSALHNTFGTKSSVSLAQNSIQNAASNNDVNVNKESISNQTQNKNKNKDVKQQSSSSSNNDDLSGYFSDFNSDGVLVNFSNIPLSLIHRTSANFKSGRDAFLKENYAEAVNFFQKDLEQKTQQYGGDSVEAADTMLELMWSISKSQTDLSQVQKMYYQTKEIVDQKFQKHPQLERVYSILAKIHMLAGLNEDAVKLFKQAIEVIENSKFLYCRQSEAHLKYIRDKDQYVEKLDDLNSTMFEIYNNLGVSLSKMNKYEEALKNYEIALHYNDSHQIRVSMGSSYEKLKQKEKALEQYNKALELAESEEGKYNNYAPMIHAAIADAYGSMGEIKKCLEHHKEGLRLYRKSNFVIETLQWFNPSPLSQEDCMKNLEVARIYKQYGTCHLKCREPQEAIINFKNCLLITEKILGKQHQQTSFIYNLLGIAHAEMNDYDTSITMFGEGIQIMESLPQIDKSYLVQLAMAYSNLGNALANIAKFGEAKVQHEKALRIKIECFGESHKITQDAKNTIKNLQIEIERQELAKQEIKERKLANPDLDDENNHYAEPSYWKI